MSRRGKAKSPTDEPTSGKASSKGKKGKAAGGSSYAEVASRGKDEAHRDRMRDKKQQAAMELQRRRKQDALEHARWRQ